MGSGSRLEQVGDILERWRERGQGEKAVHTTKTTGKEVMPFTETWDYNRASTKDDELKPPLLRDPPFDHYDFDLAEFPLFRFYKPRLAKHDKNEPIAYTDTIAGKNGVKITREWKVYPGPFGFGGQSTQVLFYDLLQLYIEQGCKGRYIYFGTLRSLFQRQGNRNPSKRDYGRMRRDIDILRGYDFHAKNAFWDAKRQAYVDMRWRLFNEVFYANEKPGDVQLELPFGCIELSSVLQRIARTRGFFVLGFTSKFFHGLKPLEQRLALYLAKKFTSQKLHRRFVEDLAKALPIEATRSDHVREILKRVVNGLFEREFPLLESFSFDKSKDGRYLAAFRRKAAPKQDISFLSTATQELAPQLAFLVDRIVEATGTDKDRAWWLRCAETLGQGGVDRALGQLRETCQLRPVRNRGAMLTKIFKDLARERGVTIQ
jgi:hypothetical protein